MIPCGWLIDRRGLKLALGMVWFGSALLVALTAAVSLLSKRPGLGVELNCEADKIQHRLPSVARSYDPPCALRTSPPIRPVSIIAHIFQSARNDHSGYLKLAGLFFSMKK